MFSNQRKCTRTQLHTILKHMCIWLFNSIIKLQENKNPCISLLQVFEDVSKINEQFTGINRRLGKVDVGKSYKHTRILISCNRTK